jgi:hypothetical protein
MNLIGKEVTHKKFGLGTIKDMQTDKVQVDFKYVIKTFAYPESFEKFFVVKDKNARNYIQIDIDEYNRLKALEQEKKGREELRQNYIRKLKIKDNSHAVFGMGVNNINEVLTEWSVSTGNFLSGANKGKPRIPKSLNMNSACLLTNKGEGERERKRTIAGIFMTEENFVGMECDTGIIHAHDKYRIIWEPEDEELYFWSFFPEKAEPEKWGNCEIKYISSTVLIKILENMRELTGSEEKKEEISKLYHYFCDINQV